MFRKLKFVMAYLFVPTMAFAVCGQCQPKEKIYVHLEDLCFDAGGIWFKAGASPVALAADALHVDSFGYYVSQKKEVTWRCPKCGNINQGVYPGFWGCSICTFPFDGFK